MSIPPMVEPITAGVLVYLINRYITSRINFCCPCQFMQDNVFETDREEERDSRDSSSTNTTVTDSQDIIINHQTDHTVYDYHPYFLTIH